MHGWRVWKGEEAIETLLHRPKQNRTLQNRKDSCEQSDHLTANVDRTRKEEAESWLQI